MAKNTKGYNTVRVLGLTEDSDLVDVRVSSSPVTSALLDLLSPCVTASDEIKVKVSGDITIESVEVDRVQLVDANGNKPIYTASGAMQTAVFDGDNETLGSTDDTLTAPTVIGNLKALNDVDFATETSLADAAASLDTIKVLDFATETTLTGTAAILTALKDTDGIKKIVDKVDVQVADGDNVALGTTTDLDSALTVIGLLKALKAKDFATQTTLATLATEAKLEAARALLETISGLDFAEETTLAAIDTAIGATTDADTELTVIGRLKKILATLEGGITVTESAPLTSVGTTVADGDDVALGSTSDTDSDTTVIGRLQKLITDLGTLADSKKLSDVITSLGYLTGISAAGAVGTLTATTTATAAIAGASALADRKGLEILNNSANLVYWGYTDGVTTGTGIPINPGVAKQFEFNPSAATPVYVIAGSDSSLYIHEWK